MKTILEVDAEIRKMHSSEQFEAASFRKRRKMLKALLKTYTNDELRLIISTWGRR